MSQRELLTAAVLLKLPQFSLQEKVTFYDPKSLTTELQFVGFNYGSRGTLTSNHSLCFSQFT